MRSPRRARSSLCHLALVAGLLAGGCANPSHPTPASPARLQAALRKALTFHASFDRGTDADYALGDPWLYQAPKLDRVQEARPGLPEGGNATLVPGAGRHGGALHFSRQAETALFYRAKDNVPWSPSQWSGAVSFWLRADLSQLAPGFADPLNLTPRSWDDAAFFVEFERRPTDAPFRLGAYADRKVWNPLNRDWGTLPANEKPLVTVPGPPFRGDRWTHVVFTWEHFNTGAKDGVALLYLDGAQVGAIRGFDQTFTWNPDQARLHLGLGYVGWMDDVAVFKRYLSAIEIQHLRTLPNGVRTLYAR